MKACSIDGCEKPSKARGWCGAHWWRWRNHGDPLGSAYVPTECSIDGCALLTKALGYCNRHYLRYRKFGDPTAGLPGPLDRTDESRFWEKVEKTEYCWNWTKYLNPKGYGQFKYQGRDTAAHRAAYLMFVGSIPSGKQVDHRCRNRACVNPSHLRLVTNKQNGEHKGVAANNASGYRGVTFHNQSIKWLASVRHEGRIHSGGLYSDVHEAGKAAAALRNTLFTHNDLDRIPA